MTDERARRAAEKIRHYWPELNEKVIAWNEKVIAAEYADVLAENERLRKRVAELEERVANLAGELNRTGVNMYRSRRHDV